MLREKILKDTLRMNVASFANQGLSVIRSLVVMRILGPQDLGTWLGLVVVLSYSTYAHLGLEYGLGNRLPFYRGNGNVKREGEVEDTVYLGWTVQSAILAAAVFLYALFGPVSSADARYGLGVIALMTVFDQQSLYYGRWQTTARADFVLPSWMAVLQSILLLIVIVPLTYLFGVRGVMAGTLAVSVVLALVWRRLSAYRYRRRLARDVYAEMIRMGFPVLIVVFGGVLIQSVDRALIAGLLDPASLGYYGVTGLGGSLLYGILAQAGSAMGPHMGVDLGKSEGAPESMERYLVKPTVVFAVVSGVFILFLYFLVPMLVRLVLPKYVPGLSAFYLFVPGFYFLGVILTANNILTGVLMVRERQRYAVAIQFGAVAVEVAVAYASIRLGGGITGVAFASTLAYAIYGLGILGMATHLVIRERRRRITFLAEVLAPFAYCGLIAAGIFEIGRNWLSRSVLLRGIEEMVLCAIASVFLLLWLNTRVRLTAEFAPLLIGLKSRLQKLALRLLIRAPSRS